MTVPKFLCVAFLSACITLISFPGFSGDTNEPGNREKTGFVYVENPKFEFIDTDGDGLITAEEAKDSWLDEVFSKVDTNQDGQISRFEYEQA